jgi:hypothetical protein
LLLNWEKKLGKKTGKKNWEKKTAKFAQKAYVFGSKKSGAFLGLLRW